MKKGSILILILFGLVQNTWSQSTDDVFKTDTISKSDTLYGGMSIITI